MAEVLISCLPLLKELGPCPLGANTLFYMFPMSKFISSHTLSPNSQGSGVPNEGLFLFLILEQKTKN